MFLRFMGICLTQIPSVFVFNKLTQMPLSALVIATRSVFSTPPMLAAPGHAEEGHHDGMICLSEWKAFFAWASEHGEGEMYLSKVEKALAAKGIKLYMTDMVIQKQFDVRVEAAFKALDADRSGELCLPEMERIFGDETHEFWEDMDGETSM